MSPRSRNRREFDVRPAGYFTVLRPSERFSTLRLLGGFRHLVNGPAVPEWLEKPAGALASGSRRNPAVGPSVDVPLQIGMLDTRNRNWAQFAMIACAAAGITYILLGWISGGR